MILGNSEPNRALHRRPKRPQQALPPRTLPAFPPLLERSKKSACGSPPSPPEDNRFPKRSTPSITAAARQTLVFQTRQPSSLPACRRMGCKYTAPMCAGTTASGTTYRHGTCGESGRKTKTEIHETRALSSKETRRRGSIADLVDRHRQAEKKDGSVVLHRRRREACRKRERR